TRPRKTELSSSVNPAGVTRFSKTFAPRGHKCFCGLKSRFHQAWLFAWLLSLFFLWDNQMFWPTFFADDF
ncbi:MAG: hypothetical protein ACP5D0_08180, partial [Hydrogenovibrio sp.]